MRFVRPPYLVRKYYTDIVWRVKTTEKNIYLTFDDGPVPEVTPWVLDILKKFGAKATFFCVGENVEKYPDLYRRIVLEGHGVGNHTYNHLNGWRTGDGMYLKNIEKCSKAMMDFSQELNVPAKKMNASSDIMNTSSSQKERRLFRPPYGRIRKSQIAGLQEDFSIVMWDVLSYDFDVFVSPEECLRYIKKKLRVGSIIVFHDSLKARKNLEYVLPRVLEGFGEKGFGFKRL